MRAVVQRVSRAEVRVQQEVAGRIGPGLLVYAASARDDQEEDVRYLVDKIAHLRIFRDANDRMNRSVLETGGGVLLVSAFTVHADARKGRRPSLDASAPGEVAEPRLAQLAQGLRACGLTVASGRFGAYMETSYGQSSVK